MLKTLAAAGLAVALAASVQAQTPPDVRSGAYKVEPDHTRVLFSVSHLGFTTYYGEFDGAAGTLKLDAASPAASQLDVTVPVTGVTTPSAKLNGELVSADWFDAAKFPAISFHSTSVTVTGPNTADVAGNLTMHGVTKPVVLKAKFNRGAPNPMNQRYTIGFEVSGEIKRSDFGVAKYVPMVGDNVDLIISAAFEKTGG